MQIAESISPRLAQEVLSITVNGNILDLTRAITNDAHVKLHKWEDDEGKHAFWHSSAHLMAEAIEVLYPGTKFGIGPTIENGFYYDIEPTEGVVIKDADLPAIENKIKELASLKHEYIRTEVTKDEALKFFGDKNETYKLELINDLEDGTITFYKQGNFTDLCRGPHLPSTAPIKAIKLLNVAGAYWRGDEKRKQLTRIYAVSFPKQKLLTEHMELLEEAMKRDHRKIRNNFV